MRDFQKRSNFIYAVLREYLSSHEVALYVYDHLLVMKEESDHGTLDYNHECAMRELESVVRKTKEERFLLRSEK